MEQTEKSRVRWLSHDADIPREVKAPSLEALFRAAGAALAASMVETKALERQDRRSVRVEGVDRESLLVAWLNEIIYLVGEGIFFPTGALSLRIDESAVEATLVGERGSRSDPRLRREVKAATYHDLSVRRTGAGWETRVLFDV